MKFKLIILSIIFPFVLSAQIELTEKEIQEDLINETDIQLDYIVKRIKKEGCVLQ